jgi:RNA polymerase sigma-70 factor (ECF subfamily)
LAAIAEANTAPPDEDADAVDRYRRGEARAFDGLVRKYQRPIYYLALRYVKDADDAKDVAQRAFVRAFQGLANFRGASTFRTWLYRIAVNLSINHLRDHKRERPMEIPEDALVAEAVGAARLESHDDRRELLRALDELPPKQRLVLELRVFEDLSFKEVADVAECSENAAKVNFHHAVKRLKAFMNPAGASE